MAREGATASFCSMTFQRLCMVGVPVLVSFYLMADLILSQVATPCSGLHIKANSKLSTESLVSQDNLPEHYISALNESRLLEEAIYSDIINTLRTLVRDRSNESGEWKSPSSGKRDSRAENDKSERVECENGNKTNSQPSVNSFRTNVFLSSANKFKNKQRGEIVLENFAGATPVRLQKNEYFLGYSGNPFGTRGPVTEVVEMPENAAGMADPRKKRSVVHLYNMVLCTTGCNPFAYKGYGCYCGFLGSGFVVDGIDSCCKMHDWCYNSAGCPMFFEYFIPYLWKCYHRQPLCAIDHGYYGGPSSCAQRLCECDRQLALCLRRYPCPSSKALCTSSPWRLLQNILML